MNYWATPLAWLQAHMATGRHVVARGLGRPLRGPSTPGLGVSMAHRGPSCSPRGRHHAVNGHLMPWSTVAVYKRRCSICAIGWLLSVPWHDRTIQKGIWPMRLIWVWLVIDRTIQRCIWLMRLIWVWHPSRFLGHDLMASDKSDFNPAWCVVISVHLIVIEWLGTLLGVKC